MTAFTKIAMAIIGGGIILDFLTHPAGTTATGNAAVGVIKSGGTIITGNTNA